MRISLPFSSFYTKDKFMEAGKVKKTTLVIMAAGIGSRFGGGIKQLESVGPDGEIMIDYSIYDALESGFNKVVFIIRKDLESEFKRIIGNRIEKVVETKYVFQELEDLPPGCQKTEGRVKPWGTGHAVLACKEVVKEPFIVINADDYYGKEAYVKIHDYLASHEEKKPYSFCMAGFQLNKTLSDHGDVTRGICVVGDDRRLASVTETFHITRQPNGSITGEDKDGTKKLLQADSRVSMNMWGLTPGFFDELEAGFKIFLDRLHPEDIKSEYLLPVIIDSMIKSKKANVTVLDTQDRWFGVTYAEDKKTVSDSIREMTLNGRYGKLS